MDKDKIKQLGAPLPEWALKDNPAKRGMTTIHPMAIIDRLNEVFGTGTWSFHTEYISQERYMQQTKNGEREMFRGLVKGVLILPTEPTEPPVVIEQFGGSSNDDLGDALKGSATDALTKIASYLGIGASIYRGQGNVGNVEPMTLDEAFTALSKATTPQEVRDIYATLPKNLRDDDEVKAKGKKVVAGLEEISNNK